MNNNGPFERPYASFSGSSSRMRQTTAVAMRASLGRHRLALIEPFSAQRSTDRNEIRTDGQSSHGGASSRGRRVYSVIVRRT